MDDIDRFLHEDLGKKGDITSDALFTDEQATAQIIACEPCILAGIQEVAKVFQKTGAEMTSLKNDGTQIVRGECIITIQGSARSILKGERLALNLLGRMSGIASETKQLVERCRKINPNITIAATRKTTPGFRDFEKKAVIIGGGEAHRQGLFDAVLIKDNHLKLIGSIEEAIIKAKMKNPDVTIEIEVETREDAITAASLSVDVIMLDNMSPTEGKKVAETIRKINSDILIELSGGITKDNIINYASFADRISLGYITHSVKNKDFSLEILEQF